MKKIYYFLLLMLTLNVACDDFLNVNPAGEVVNDELFKEAEGFEDALYGVYSFMARTPLYGKNLSYYALDIVGQYFYYEYSTNWTKELCQYNYKHQLVRPEIDTIWKSMYKNIANVNNVLDNLKGRSGDLPLFDVYKAESLGMRAFMHFELLRLYSENIIRNPDARGIPYCEEYTFEVSPWLSAKETYDRIIRDLEEAELLLSNHGEYFDREDANAGGFVKDRVIHMNLYAVQGILARVYWSMGNLEKAKDYALKVIDCGFFTLEEKTDIENMVNGVLSAKETIFGIYSDEFFNYTRQYLYTTTGGETLTVKADYEDIYNEDKEGFDYRLDKWFKVNSDWESVGLRCMKLVDSYRIKSHERESSRLSGINLLRLPELYYIVAEYYLTQDDQENATLYFDPVLKSRGLRGFAGRDGLKLALKHINNERHKEFVCEGQWFHVMKHYNMDAYDSVSDRSFPASTDIYVFPVPDSENQYRD